MGSLGIGWRGFFPCFPTHQSVVAINKDRGGCLSRSLLHRGGRELVHDVLSFHLVQKVGPAQFNVLLHAVTQDLAEAEQLERGRVGVT